MLRSFRLSGHIPSLSGEASNVFKKLFYLTNRASVVPDRPVRVWLMAHGEHQIILGSRLRRIPVNCLAPMRCFHAENL
jgi:hypothetical protein